MLNAKKLDRLFAKANLNPAEDPYLAMIRAAAKATAELHIVEPEWTKEELSDALHGRRKLFDVHTVALPQADFLRVFASIREAVLAASGNDAAWQGMPAPEAIFTQENLDVLSHNPDALWDMMEKSGVDLEKAQEQFLPAAAYTMRAFFDAVAWDASNEMERLIPDTIHFERNLTCPVCGSSANIAGVGATQNHGNVKRLYCSCCGANWQFERIRCAVCGTEATSDLEYVHMHGDDKHRLHVCKACGSATPTIFGSEVDDFDPDLEAWRCAELMAVYQDQSAQAEGDKDKGGNA